MVSGCNPGETGCGFDPTWTAHVLAGRLPGTRWATQRHGLLEVTAAESVELHWPIELRLTLADDYWPAPRSYLVEFTSQDTFASATPAGNAEHLAEQAMYRIEHYLDRGSAPGVIELTPPRHLDP